MKNRKLRIAWSVTCGILCLLLVALWGRSYWWLDSVNLPVSSDRTVAVGSISGTIAFAIGFGRSPLELVTMPANEYAKLRIQGGLPPVSPITGTVATSPSGIGVFMPYWFVLSTVLVMASAPWVCWRFSLRTLLIGITVVAVLLGAKVLTWK